MALNYSDFMWLWQGVAFLPDDEITLNEEMWARASEEQKEELRALAKRIGSTIVNE